MLSGLVNNLMENPENLANALEGLLLSLSTIAEGALFIRTTE